MKSENQKSAMNVKRHSQCRQSLTTKDVCTEFFGGCSKSTFWRLRNKDKSFPAPFSLGGNPLWNREDLQNWYDSKREAAA